MNGWHTYWAAWALITFGAFSIPEMAAVFSGHPERKLSSAAWVFLDSLPWPPVWRIIAVITTVVIVFHLFFGPRH